MISFEPITASPTTHHTSNSQPPLHHRPFSDPNHLAPEDAFLAHSPPTRKTRDAYASTSGTEALKTDQYDTWTDSASRRKREKERGRSGSRRRKGEWKKLLWVRHPGCMSISPARKRWVEELTRSQIPTTTLILLPFSPIYSETHACSFTTSGPW